MLLTAHSQSNADDGQPADSGSCCLLTSTDLCLTPSLRSPLHIGSSHITIRTLPEEQAAARLENAGPNGAQRRHQPVFSSFPESALQLMRILYQLSGLGNPNSIAGQSSSFRSSELPAHSFSAAAGDFISDRLTKKLVRQLHDPLCVTTGSMHDWCRTLGCQLPQLFSLAVRLDFLRACAFGPARLVVIFAPPLFPCLVLGMTEKVILLKLVAGVTPGPTDCVVHNL